MRRDQAGDSLIEIILAIVVIGVVVSALLAAIVTNENGSVSHRDMVKADHILRNYAEQVKSDVRTGCTSAGAVWASSYTVPSGTGAFTINTLSSAQRTCPSLTAAQVLTLQVTLPSGSTKSLAIAVRTP
jgi:Tfp pilus assembly protein PilV